MWSRSAIGGEFDHSFIQAKLIALLMVQGLKEGILPIPEWRFQIKPTRFRVPDVIVIAGKPGEQILTKPPLLCIEILSPEDRISRVNQRIREYLVFGVPVVSLIDPADKTLWVYRQTGMEEAIGTVKLEGTSIEIPFSEIFD